MHELARRSISRKYLTDSCAITRESEGQGTLNETTFEVTLPEPTAIYSGVCSVTDRVSSRSDRDAFQDLADDELLLKLPADVEGPTIGDLVEISTAGDPVLAGRQFKIERYIAGSHSITRRVVMKRIVAFPNMGEP